MNILSLDMSSKKSGYSIFKDGELIDYGCWELSFDDENDWRKRILFMADKLNECLKEQKIDKVFAEDVPVISSNDQTLKILSALHGCVMSICHLRKVECEFISVRTWKKIVGIDITHSKEFMAYKKLHKEDNTTKFKGLVKSYEKKMSVDLVNKVFNLDFIYKSSSIKLNQDDIFDSIFIKM